MGSAGAINILIGPQSLCATRRQYDQTPLQSIDFINGRVPVPDSRGVLNDRNEPPLRLDIEILETFRWIRISKTTKEAYTKYDSAFLNVPFPRLSKPPTN